MYRSVILVVVAGIVGLLATGCVTNAWTGGPTPAGIIYTKVVAPAQHLAIHTDSTATPTKVGKATMTAFLGCVSLGDGSLQAALKDAGITRVHHVDYELEHFLYGIFFKQTTMVYGE